MTNGLKWIFGLLLAGAAFAQTPIYPGGVATDANLGVARNNVQTTITSSMTPTSTSFTVYSATGIVVNQMLSIGKSSPREIVWVCGVSGNTIQVGRSTCPNVDGRGVDSSTAVQHLSGEPAQGMINAWYFNALSAEVKSIEANVNGGVAASALAQYFNFTAQAPGGSLIAGGVNQAITMAPCPLGVNGSNPGYWVYLSGGTGGAETVTVNGGTCTSGATSGTLLVTPTNNHSGAWTVGPASGGLQEAICSFGSNGGTAIVGSSLTLRAHVNGCGKTAVLVQKQAGTIITGAFLIFGAQPVTFSGSPVPDAEYFTYGNVTVACADCPGATPRPVNFPVTFVGGSNLTPAWQQVDSVVMIGRSSSDSIGTASGLARNTLSVSTDYRNATGTVNGIISLFRADGVTGGNGGTSIAGYTQLLNGTTAEQFGVHGQCDVNYQVSGNPTCVAINAEGSSTVAGGAGTAGMIGIESNMNTTGVATANTTVLGAEIQMNNFYNNLSSNSIGLSVHANHNTVAKGVYIADTGGKFTNPLTISSASSPATPIALLNIASGTNNAPNAMTFYRSNTAGDLSQPLASVQAEHGNGDFSNGILRFRTTNTGTLANVLSLDQFKNASFAGHITQDSGNHDAAGSISLSAATSAAYSFGYAYASAPVCSVTPGADPGAGLRYWVTTSTTAITVHTSASATLAFNYTCVGNPN